MKSCKCRKRKGRRIRRHTTCRLACGCSSMMAEVLRSVVASDGASILHILLHRFASMKYNNEQKIRTCFQRYQQPSFGNPLVHIAMQIEASTTRFSAATKPVFSHSLISLSLHIHTLKTVKKKKKMSLAENRKGREKIS